MDENIQIGDIVRFAGLQAAKFNGHVGTVKKMLPESQDGRVGVELHSSVWPRGAVASAWPSPRLSIEPELRCISVRRENLRRVHVGPRAPRARVGLLGGPPPPLVPLLLRQLLPADLAQVVADFLTCLRVDPREVAVTRCSSDSGQHPLSEALTPSCNTWWISGPGTTPRGVGNEWLEFDFGRTVRRVSYLGIRIPPLPHGPLSVRDFHLLCATTPACATSPSTPEEEGGDASEWQPCTGLAGECLHTLDHEELQEFAFSPPLEATRGRLVCTKNAAADLAAQSGPDDDVFADCIGLFEVRFL